MKKCECVYENVTGPIEKYWTSRKHQKVKIAAQNHAIYIPGSNQSGIIIISDAIGKRVLKIIIFIRNVSNSLYV